MLEIYFINDYFVRTTNWKLAFISWLDHNGDLNNVINKAVLAMDTVDEILEIIPMFTDMDVEYFGIAREFVSNSRYIELHECLEKADDNYEFCNDEQG